MSKTTGFYWYNPKEMEKLLKFRQQRENWFFRWMQLPIQEQERIRQLRIQRSLLNHENNFVWVEIRYGKTLKRVWCDKLTSKIYKADMYSKTLIEIKQRTYSFIKFLSLNDI